MVLRLELQRRRQAAFLSWESSCCSHLEGQLRCRYLQWHGNAGSVLINGTEYPLQQAHWHSPSEHTVNGRKYAMEMHMVHLNENATNKIAVIGVLYKFGKPDKFLSKLIRNISSMIDKKDEVKNAGMINPREMKIGSRKWNTVSPSLALRSSSALSCSVAISSFMIFGCSFIEGP
ncbi:alpha carbonic anhydrase 2-like [Nicotiana tabacum]|uniref:Alpha carbonic anhydrase 2-like n=1 Tax=Nicotiana tabacum TaxID=4097 RepID=A0AC58SIB9_TOBAC